MFEHESKALVSTLEKESQAIMGEISDYSQRYLKQLLATTAYNVQLSAILLERVVRETQKEPGELHLVDFGGGIGITSLLAKKAGFRTITYLDIYKPVAVDAQRIGYILGLTADQYIQGDIRELVHQDIAANALVSRDVIEHVYDLEDFFRQTQLIHTLEVQVHNTSANIYNILLKKYFNKIHFEAEYQNIRPSENLKEGEVLKGYYHARKDIIQKEFPEIPVHDADRIARLTRGFNREDILHAMEMFIKDGEEPIPVKHPTNTCEPETGNWAERLLSIEEYRNYATGYDLRYFPCPYNVKRNWGIRKLALFLLNFAIFKLKAGPSIWPSILLVFKPSRNAGK